MTRPLLGLLTLAGAVAVAAGIPFAGSAATGAGSITFMGNASGNYDIYSMSADGSGVTDLTNSPASDQMPSWSPDRTQIAFSTRIAGNRDGRREDRLHPTDAPLPFLGPSVIWVMHADGTQAKPLTPDDLHAAFPDWSPDGSRIVFANNVCPTCDLSDIYTINPGGNHLQQLTHDLGNNLQPRWSPDGSMIVFTNTSDFETFNEDIWTMGADGSNPVDLTNSPTSDEQFPDW